MIHVKIHELQVIKTILAKYSYTFYLFGSRLHGEHKPLSDLDLCFKEPIPWEVQSRIEEDFEESDLPFTVDLVDFHLCSQEFQQSIEQTLQKI